MHLKHRLRHLLRDYLKSNQTTSHKQTLTLQRATIQPYKFKPSTEPHLGCFLRVLTVSKSDSEAIESILHHDKDKLGIVSLRSSPTGYENTYPHSVIVESSLEQTFKELWQSHSNEDKLGQYVRESFSRDPGARSSANRSVLIDFSSPNIAKPFHFGHLKSTILGNFLANLNTFLSNKVTKLNYLGDWGTQYGLVSLGFDRFGDEEGLKKNSLRHLLDVYVKASNLAKEDTAFYDLAREKFLLMDEGADKERLEQWSRFRDLTLSELTRSYERLGIEFDVYDFESNYRHKARELVQLLEDRGLLKTADNGAKLLECVRDNHKYSTPVLKSDGASLYLTRDIAAAIDRQQRFNFDEMLYVVGMEQGHHMTCLFDSLRQLNLNWYDKLRHVETGRISGMSTRSGNFVLLDDILEEVTRRYVDSTKNTPTSKLDGESEILGTSRQLALSALFVYDMRNPRKKSYEFDWDAIVMASPKSGLAIQAAYARLSSLLGSWRATDLKVPENSIECIETANLLTCLNSFDDVLFHSNEIMDPSPLLRYSFELSQCSNRALQSKHLRIRGEVEDIALARLALFSCVHNVLGTIIKLIGLKPLERI